MSGQPTIYVLKASDGRVLYVGSTSRPAQRVREHRHSQCWWTDVADCEVHSMPSITEARRVEAELIRRWSPTHNSHHILAHGHRGIVPSESVAEVAMGPRRTPAAVQVSNGYDEALMILSDEACSILRISRATLTRWVAKGRLRAAGRLAVANGAFYFDRAEVERVAANRAA